MYTSLRKCTGIEQTKTISLTAAFKQGNRAVKHNAQQMVNCVSGEIKIDLYVIDLYVRSVEYPVCNKHTLYLFCFNDCF